MPSKIFSAVFILKISLCNMNKINLKSNRSKDSNIAIIDKNQK